MAETGLCRVRMFGGLSVHVSGRPPVDRFRTRKTGAALAYLAYFPERAHTRDELIELFWPEADAGSGRQSLSTVLTSLRNVLEPPGIEPGSVLKADRRAVGLRAESLATDVRVFEDALRSAARTPLNQVRLEAYERAMGLYAGPLLQGFDEIWALAERERLQEVYGFALADAAGIHQRAGTAHRAISLARSAVAAEPFQESHHLLVARLLWESGDQRSAVRALDEWDRIVRTEFGDRPSAESLKLRSSIESGPRPTVDSDRGLRESVATRLADEGANNADPRQAEPHSQRLGHVPRLISRFFGREAEIARIGEHLSSGRTTLLTLTGPGGIGKTRLAIEVARRVLQKGEATPWFVSLADLREAEHVATTVAEALGLSPAESSVGSIGEFLTRYPTVLILDNLEHLPGVADWTRRLLDSSPELPVIVTSRQRLGLDGETELAIGPLPVPEEVSGPEQLLAVPAVALFVDRAQSSRPDFQITPRNADAIASLCVGLEGIPLALELAAARSQVLTPAQMLGQLEDRFTFLVNKKRPVTERHKTMVAAVQWSCDLLPSELQRFFVQLSVFRGGWTAEAAERVLDEPQALEFLEKLVDCSLVRAEESGGGMRFKMLEMILAYAGGQCATCEKHRLRSAHAAHFLAFAESTATLIKGPSQAEWLLRFAPEQENVQQALEFSAEHDPLLGLRLAVAASTFWEISANTIESRRWIEAFLALPFGFPDDLRAVALATAGNMCTWAGEFSRAKEYLSECLQTSRRLGRFDLVGGALVSLAFALSNLRDPAVWSVLEEGLELADRLGATPLRAAVLLCRSMEQAFAGEYDASLESSAAGYALGKEIGDPFLLGRLTASFGSSSLLCGNVEDAGRLFREGLEVAAACNDLVILGIAHWGLSLVALRNEHFDEFVEHWNHHDLALKRSGVLWGYPHLIESASAAELAGGRENRAVLLYAAAEALRARLQIPQPVGNHGMYPELFDALPALRQRPDLARAWRLGASLSWEEAVEYARSDRDLPQTAGTPFF